MDMRQKIFAGLAAAVVVVAVTLTLSDRTDQPVAPFPPPPDLPSFSSTPAPQTYASISDLADALTNEGLRCEVDEQDTPHEDLKGFGECNLLGHGDLNISLWLFESQQDRDAWIAGTGTVTRVVGPKWMITTEDESRADAVMGAIGGELVLPTEG